MVSSLVHESAINGTTHDVRPARNSPASTRPEPAAASCRMIGFVPSAPSDTSFAHCREVARDVRRSPNWRSVRETLRPRGVAWTFRSRAPLPVLLYLAARDGRLVEEASGCALLERPWSHRDGRGGARLARFLDSYWDPLMFGVPVFLVLAAAVPVGLLAGPTAGVGVVAAALTYVTLLMALVVVRQLLALTAGRRRLVDTAVGQLRRNQWTVTLLHAAGTAAATDLLVRARAAIGPDTPPLLVLRGGISGAGPAARGSGGLQVVPVAPRHPVLVAYRRTDPPLQVPTGPGTFRGRDLAVVLGGTALFVLVLAAFVARDESRVCGAECDGLPARYGDALYWLLSRLIGGDPDGLGATSAGNRTIGLLVTVYGVFVLVAIIGRVVQQRVDEDLRSGQDVAAAFERQRAGGTPPRRSRPRHAATPRTGRRRVARPRRRGSAGR